MWLKIRSLKLCFYRFILYSFYRYNTYTFHIYFVTYLLNHYLDYNFDYHRVIQLQLGLAITEITVAAKFVTTILKTIIW